jgi:hypothetical protein
MNNPITAKRSYDERRRPRCAATVVEFVAEQRELATLC